MFTNAERAYIGSLAKPGHVRLARFATSTAEGQPHVVPLRAVLHETEDKVIVLGREMAHSYKYRQVQKNPKVAIVWDSQEAGPPPTIKGIEVRGRAVIKQNPGDRDPYLEVTPTKVFSWGINEPADQSFEQKMGMDVSHLRRQSE